MGSVTRFGVERDRPFLRKYLVGLGLGLTAGLFALLSLVIVMGGAAIRDALDWGETLDSIWRIARWPLGLAFATASVALLFEHSPSRRQPEASWLAFGATVSVLLWHRLVRRHLRADCRTIGVLLWTFLSSVALFIGLAFAAQLEAVRASVPEPRRDPQEGTRAESSRL